MANVIIIGAGISGLCAARLLSSKGIEVTVLEARDRVGGRTHTAKDDSYGYTDLGGAYVGSGQRRIWRLARELGVELYKVDISGKTVSDIEGLRMEFEGIIPPMYNPIKIMDINNIIQKLNTMAKEVPIEEPWNAPDAEKLDSMTFQQFIDETCWTNFSKEMVKLLIRALTSGEPCEISLLSMLCFIHSSMGIEKAIEIEQGAQEFKIVGGAQEISNKMAEELKGRIKFSEPVIRVQETEDKLIVTTSPGNVYEADYVISGMPQTLLNRVEFIPPLPPLKLQMIQRIPMSPFIKTMMFYKTAFWKDKGFSGEMVTNSGPVLGCIDDTKPDGSHPALMGFIVADQARNMTLLTPNERKTKITESYARVFKCDEFLKPVNYIEKNWMDEEYSGGGPDSNFPPGVLTRYGDQLRQPHGKVHFAGTESATMWVGYMDGAVQAGERAANEVLYALGRIAKHEINVEERESPDFPDRPIEPLWIEKKLPSVGQFLFVMSIVCTALISWGIKMWLM